jgi:peptidoglycan hydrolase-like protein with peptidoglycan-binding domain
LTEISNIKEDVKELQKLLKIPADGIFGRQTETAVKDFQKKYNLAVDGIAGPKTIALLLG